MNGNGAKETLGARIVREMSELGFEPTAGVSAFTIQFAKVYADHEGKVIRACVQFDKPVMGQPNIMLGSFVISTQEVVMPEASALDNVPEIARSDLSAILGNFGESTQLPPRSAALRDCIHCGERVGEYYVVNEDAVCFGCVKEAQVG